MSKQQPVKPSRQSSDTGTPEGISRGHGGQSIKPIGMPSEKARTEGSTVLFEKNTWHALETDLAFKVEKGQRHELTIQRSTPQESFGFSLGTSKALKFVSELKDSGPAIKVLKKYDVIDTIAGEDAKPLSHPQAVDIIKAAGLSLKIAVYRSVSQDFSRRETKRRPQDQAHRSLDAEPWFIKGDGASVTAE